MDKILIKGGKPLHGSVEISGAKNAALPAMAATLLTEDQVVLHNIPCVRDIQTTGQVLKELGCKSDLRQLASTHSCQITAKTIVSCEAPYELVKTMRASVLVFGPLLARFGKARVSLPGGCAIEARPIDLHIKAFEKLGAEITLEHGYVEARSTRLKGSEISFDRITVTGTENLMMAATLAEGETVLNNAAREPEVVDLANLLRTMGARISGDGSSAIRIQGVENLHGAEHTVIPDRIETGTFLVASAITGGEVEIRRCRADHLSAVIEKLEEAGVKVVRQSPSRLTVSAPVVKRSRYNDGGIPRLRHGHAGSIYGSDDAGGRDIDCHRDNLREPFHACQRDDPNGRKDKDRGQSRPCSWQDATDRRPGHCVGSASERLAGAGCLGRQGGNSH